MGRIDLPDVPCDEDTAEPKQKTRSKQSGAFTVSGPPGIDGRAPSLGAAISLAQTYATLISKSELRKEEPTIYVRDALGQNVALVVVTADGMIHTRSYVGSR